MGVDMVVVMVVVVGRILDTIIIILLTPSKGKTYFLAKSGIMMRQNKKIEKVYIKKPFKAPEKTCYRCGMEGHWSRTCRTTKHLVDMYQVSLKDKRKMIETNFVVGNRLNLFYFDMDFF